MTSQGKIGMVVVLSLALIFSAMPGTALAQPTVHVYNIMDEYQSSHNTIQGGINAANDWWTVKVEEGVYNESPNLNKEGISVESTDGAGVTTLEGYFNVDARNVTIDGFSVDASGYVNAIFDTAGEDGLVVKNNQVTGGTRGMMVDAEMEVLDNEFDNMLEGIQIASGIDVGQVEIAGNFFADNTYHVKSYLDDEDFMESLLADNDFAVPAHIVEGEGLPWDWAIVDVPVYQVTFSEQNNLEGVEIAVDDQTAVTDNNGEAIIELPDGDYEFTASKDYYLDYEGDFSVSGGPEAVSFTMEVTDYFEVEITDYPASLDPGQAAVVEYTVENLGGKAGTQNIVLEVNGEVVDSENQALSAGAIALSTLTSPANALQSGENDIAVVSDNDRAEVTILVTDTDGPVDKGAAEVRMYIGSTTILVDGVEEEIDVAPFIQQGRTFVPVRFLAEAFASVADWGPKDTRTEWVTLTRADIDIYIEIGEEEIIATRDGVEETVIADAPARIVNGRTMLPFRAIAEAFGADVDYASDPDTGLVTEVWFTQQI